jgi:glucan endo-1,3-alpha-glucosidase
VGWGSRTLIISEWFLWQFNWFSTSDTAAVINIMKPLIGLPAQHRVAGSNAAFVSTFSGDGFNWSAVRSAFPSTPLYIVPNWQPSSENARNAGVDGLFSWYAWPSVDNGPVDRRMSTDKDQEYIRQLSGAGKAYMAPVSPWCEFALRLCFPLRTKTPS